MLLKYTQAQKRIKATGIGKPQRTAGGMVKLSSGLVTVVPKIHRRVIKVASKRPAAVHRTPSIAVKREQISLEACDSSNDSGLGFDHHLDYSVSHPLATQSALRFSDKASWHTEESPEEKRRRLEIKLESDDANDNFTFPETVRQQSSRAVCMPVRGRARVVSQAALTLSSQLSSVSHNGLTQIVIACQPEQQHRARYQTEGSRGAVKDRTGNGFPIVKLVGYERPATLQVFIGTDQGRVAPHMFYQACRVSGKNSTPCVEKKVDGTIVIEVDIEPAKEMVVTCDCVGILKERNVDVEHRFPEESTGRSKKKSTRCRMVFRTTITNPDGSQETLQVTSQPIVCTQPPGVPEICKKSLSSCSVQGGQELFILGKNFLKDTRVLFQEGETWTQSVQPDKEFLQQSHLVCVVPPYQNVDITEPVTVRLVVESSGKASEPHAFVYLPTVLATDGTNTASSVIAQVQILKRSGAFSGPIHARRRYKNGGSTGMFPAHLPGPPPPLLLKSEAVVPSFIATQTSPQKEEKVHPVMIWEKPADVIMPPPSSLLPLPPRRSSVQMIVPDQIAPEDMKREVPDVVLDTSKQQMVNGSDLCSTRSPSMDTFHRFVSNNSLPTINVSSYLSNIEGNVEYASKPVPSHLVKDVPQIMIPSVNNPTFSGDSSNLLTTVNQSSSIPFDTRNLTANSSASHSNQENLSVIVNSPMIQKKLTDNLTVTDSQQRKQISEQQNVGIDLLVNSLMKKQAAEMTERLDAFVNSAAESHISPNPESSVSMSPGTSDASMGELVGSETSETKTNVQSIMQPGTIPITTSQNLSSINEGNLCSLLNNSSQQASVNQEQTVSSIQATLDQLSNQSIKTSQTNMTSLMQSSPQVSANHAQVLSDLKASIEEQLSNQSVTPISSSDLNCTDLNNLMQTDSQVPTSHAQQLANLQATLNHQLSPRTVVVNANHSNLSNLVPHSDTTNLQISLEPKLSPHNLNSPQLDHSNFDNLISTTSQNTPNETQQYSNIQVSLEQHLSSQSSANSTQIPHSESVQSSSPSLNDVSSVMHTAAPTSVNDAAQALSNLQATLEHQLSSQMMRSVQPNHESLANRTLVLNSSLRTSPEVQAAVNQAQAISNLQASLEHHLSSQVIDLPQSPMVQMSHSQSNLNLSTETSQVTANQSQTLNNLHMSLDQLTSQVLTPTQQTQSSITDNLSLTTNPQIQAAVSQSQVLSNLQASLEHHLNTQVMGVTRTSPQPMMTLDNLNSSIQTSPQHSPNQAIPTLQVSLDQISSQALSSSQAHHSESASLVSTQSMRISSPLSLINSQTLTTSDNRSISSPELLSSSPSHQGPACLLTPSGMSLNSTLSPTGLTMHNPQPMEIRTSNIVMNTPRSLSSPDLTLNDNSTLSVQPPELQIQCSQSSQFQQKGLSHFEQSNSDITQRLPVQIVTLAQYDRCQEMQSSDIKRERKEQPSYVTPAGATTVVQTQTASAQAVKKVEEGIQELAQMSEHDLIRYINPSCFDTV